MNVTPEEGDISSWTESRNLAGTTDVSWTTYVSGGSVFMRVWVNPSDAVNFIPSGMSNTWELRFYVTG